MEFRSLIQKIFGNSGNEPDAPNSVRMELINDWKNVFFSSGLHTNDTGAESLHDRLRYALPCHGFDTTERSRLH